MQIEWSDTYLLNLAVVDRQHQEMFRRVNRLLDAIERGEGRHEIHRTMSFLKSYIVAHFGAEEVLMRRARYPMVEAHAMEHHRFARSVRTMAKQLDALDDPEPMLPVISNELGGWLQTHIMKSDQLFGAYLQRNETPALQAMQSSL